jgi:tetratricopeptide (TPR) repeat protein
MEQQRSPFLHDIGDRLKVHFSCPTEKVVERLLGGFSAVYVTESADAAMPVTVLKTPRADLDLSRAVIETFANEATLWSRLPSHPNILPIYSVRMYNRLPYLRLHYIPPLFDSGSSAGSIIEMLNPGEHIDAKIILLALGQMSGLLRDLETLTPGFCHGDIKPDNILVMEDILAGGVRFLLTDFGLARARLPLIRDTSAFAGDLLYLAPEVLAGEPPTPASDVYALGCTAFEMCFGMTPNSPEFQQLASIHQSVTLSGPALPDGCFELIQACIRREPTDRIRYAEMIDGVAACLQSIGIGVRRVALDKWTSPSWIKDVSESPLVPYLMQHRGLKKEQAEAICWMLTEAATFRHVGRFGEADQIASQIERDLPKFPPVLAARAFALFEQEQFMDATVAYMDALMAYDEDLALVEADRGVYASVCASLAQLLIMPERQTNEGLEFALRLTDQALRYTPFEPRATMCKGNVELRLGRISDAVNTLSSAHDLDPGNRPIRRSLVMALATAGRGNLRDLAAQYDLTAEEISGLGFPFRSNRDE